MFVAVSLESTGKGIKSRIKRLRKIINIEQIQVRHSFFYKLTYYCNENDIGWKKLLKVLGRERNRLLFPENLKPSKESGIKRYDKNKFEMECLTDVFCDIISSVNSKLPIILIDAEGRLQKIAERLIGSSSQLIIFTKKISEYDDFRRKALLRYGTEPVVTDSTGVFSAALAVFTPEWRERAFIPQTTPVFGRKGCADYYIDEESIVLPEDFSEVIPTGISKIEFLAALKEQCGISQETKTFCKYLCKNGGKSSINNVVLTFSVLT